MALYDLVVDGYNDFFARRVGAKRQLRREPLSGLVDGANTEFLSPLFPILASTAKLYVGGVQWTNPAQFTLEADLGVFTLYAAPSYQPRVDVEAVPLTTAQVTLYCWAGFELMEALWTRKYTLSSNSATYAPAARADSHIYVVKGPLTVGDPVIDPICGDLTFATSLLQKQVLAQCTELAYLDAMVYEASLGDIDFSERIGGARISASRRPANLKMTRDLYYEQHVIPAIYAAWGEVDADLEFLGQQTLPPHTDDYEQLWQWQATGSIGSLYIPSGLRWIQA